MVAYSPHILAAHPSVPAKDAKELVALAKSVAHWLSTSLPLAIAAPFLGFLLNLSPSVILPLFLAMTLGSITLSLLAAIGAAVTVGLRRGGLLVSLLVLPLAMPLLIFGARAVSMAMDGDSPAGPLQLLAAIFFLVLSLGPLAVSAAIRISVEN